MKIKILILCTGNSCRSQMAEGFLKTFDNKLEVFSAGTIPAEVVNPNSIFVMNEIGINLNGQYPKSVDIYLNDEFDFVITVCSGAKQICPTFTGKVKNRIHIGFDDPADATGTVDEILSVYRRVRDEIKRDFYEFYKNNLSMKLN